MLWALEDQSNLNLVKPWSKTILPLDHNVNMAKDGIKVNLTAFFLTQPKTFVRRVV